MVLLLSLFGTVVKMDKSQKSILGYLSKRKRPTEDTGSNSSQDSRIEDSGPTISDTDCHTLDPSQDDHSHTKCKAIHTESASGSSDVIKTIKSPRTPISPLQTCKMKRQKD